MNLLDGLNDPSKEEIQTHYNAVKKILVAKGFSRNPFWDTCEEECKLNVSPDEAANEFIALETKGLFPDDDE